MKYSFLFKLAGLLGVVCCWGLLTSATLTPVIIKGKVKNSGETPIVYTSSVDGISVFLSKDTLKLEPDGSFAFAMPAGSSEKITFMLCGKSILGAIYARPGMTEIEIDVTRVNDIRTIRGAKAENEAMKSLTALNNNVWDFRAGRGDVFNVGKDTIAGSVYYKLLTYSKQMKTGLKGVSEAFENRARQDIRMQLLLVFSIRCWDMLSRDTTTETTKTEWKHALTKMSNYVELDQPYNVWSDAFSSAIRSWAQLQMYSQNSNSSPKDMNEYNRMLSDAYIGTLEGKVQEVALACVIIEDYLDEKQTTGIPELCDQFKASFPESALLKRIDKIKVENVAFNQAVASEEIHFMDVNGMSSLKEITDRFVGKVVFIDIWATWCGPCRDSFAHVKPLQQYARENEVVLLYITIDRPENTDLWKKMAVHYDLKGEHLIVNAAIDKDLRRQFGKNNTLIIPHCAIVNKKGEMEFRKAVSPEEIDKLTIQLKEAAK